MARRNCLRHWAVPNQRQARRPRVSLRRLIMRPSLPLLKPLLLRLLWRLRRLGAIAGRRAVVISQRPPRDDHSAQREKRWWCPRYVLMGCWARRRGEGLNITHYSTGAKLILVKFTTTKRGAAESASGIPLVPRVVVLQRRAVGKCRWCRRRRQIT